MGARRMLTHQEQYNIKVGGTANKRSSAQVNNMKPSQDMFRTILNIHLDRPEVINWKGHEIHLLSICVISFLSLQIP